MIKHIDIWKKRILASICSLLVIANAAYIFRYNTYPMLADSYNLSQNLTNVRFDLKIIVQEILAYFLFVFGVALLGRSRTVWSLTITNLVMALIFSNFYLTNITYNAAVLIILTIVTLIASYRVFNQQLFITYSFSLIIAFLIQALFYGTMGTYILRDEFHGIKTIHDAIYFCLETYSTVGYGDIYPTTQTAKYFVISMIITGLIIFTSGITLIGLTFSAKMKNLMFNINKGKISMKNHVVLIGYGITAKILVERYLRDDTSFIVIDASTSIDTDREILKEQNKLLISPYAGSTITLERARINEAQLIVINYENDADTILAIMSTSTFLKKHNRQPQIVARIYFEENIERAKACGADIVIAPNVMVADQVEALRQQI